MIMAPSEYFDRCFLIDYRKSFDVGGFGEPMSCYGFVYWFYRLCKGIELPSADVSSFEGVSSVDYVSTDSPVDGDVVDLRSTDGVGQTHVGILYKDCVYHFTRDGLLCKNRFRMSNWIKGYYHVVQNKT